VDGYLPIGERIRLRRRARGLSQLRLAGLVDRSEDWVSKVERGEIPIDRISVLLRVAEALKVPLSDLLGDDNWPAEQIVPSETAELRRVLSSVPRAADAEPRSLDVLDAELVTATRHRAEAHYAATATALPGLIGELTTATYAHDGDQRRHAFGLLARAYGLAVATLVRYGQHDLAWVAADRGVHAADWNGTLVERTLAAYRLAHAFLGAGRLQEAIEVANRAMEQAAEELTAALRSLTGATYLPLAIAEARSGDRGRAYGALREAEALTVGPGGRFEMPADLQLATQFSPANVAAHQVAVAVDLGDAGDAISLAERVDPGGLSVSRYSRHRVDVALAYNMRRDTDGMVGCLLEVERLAPEQLVHLALVREVLHSALRRERGLVNAELHGLAERVGAL